MSAYTSAAKSPNSSHVASAQNTIDNSKTATSASTKVVRIAQDRNRMPTQDQIDIVKRVNNVMLNNRRLSFFGTLLYGYKKVICTPEESERFSKQFGFKFMAACDFKENIYLNLDAHHNYKDVIFSLLHEQQHILGCHFERQGQRDQKLWNACTDHCINEGIEKLKSEHANGHTKDGKRQYILFESVMQDFPFIKAEKLYDMFQQKTQKVKLDENGDIQKDCKGEPVPGDGNGLEGEISYYDLNYKNDKAQVFKEGKLKYNGQDFEIENHIRNVTPEQAQKIRMQASALWNSPVINKGDIPDAVRAYFDDLLQVKIPWNEVLENALKTELTPVEARSWHRLNWLITCTNLPINVANDLTVSDMLFVMDVSSSVSMDDIKLAISICLDARRSAGIQNLETITHNVDVVERWENLQGEQEVIDSLTKMKVGGGTSHQGVWEHIRKHLEGERTYSVVVLLTDAYSDIEQTYEDFPDIHHIPLVWMLNSNYDLKTDWKVIRVK